VTGAAGMLGTALVDVLSRNHEVLATDLRHGSHWPNVHWDTMDLLDSVSLGGWLSKWRPEAVVHCAAQVDVDACERDPDRAEALHAGVTRCLTGLLRGWGGRLIYISTDAVFDGRKAGPYNELDVPHPLNAYARTKLLGEAAALSDDTSLVLRTNIFGWSRGERMSFAEWVLRGLVEGTRLTMFTDVRYTPIHVTHLSVIIARCLALGTGGLYHASGSSALSKHDFALRMAAVFGLDDAGVVRCSVDDVGLSAPRPKNMELANGLLSDALSCRMASVEQGLELMRTQYEDGWAAIAKGRALKAGWRFWEVV
jgi:dTDP-4-dehydrorhamnose reductase